VDDDVVRGDRSAARGHEHLRHSLEHLLKRRGRHDAQRGPRLHHRTGDEPDGERDDVRVDGHLPPGGHGSGDGVGELERTVVLVLLCRWSSGPCDGYDPRSRRRVHARCLLRVRRSVSRHRGHRAQRPGHVHLP
jgi:hypothetical protein